MATPFDSIGGLLGIDPEQLKQLMAAMGPQEEDRKAANMQALTQLGLGLLGTRKGYEWEQLGNAGQNALMARQQAMQGAQAGRMDQVKMAEQLAKLKAGQEEAKRKQGVNAQLAGLFGVGNQAPGPASEGTAPSKPKWQIYEEAAQIALQNEDVARAKQYAELADANRPKIKDQKTLTQNGKRIVVNLYTDGSTQVVPDLGPDAEKLQFVNAGGTIIPSDPFTGAAAGDAIPVTMDAAQKDASARGWAQYGLSKAAADRAAKEGAGGGKPQLVNGQWVFPPDAQNPTGRAVTPEGMAAGGGKALTESQAKATAFVNQMQNATATINDLESKGFDGKTTQQQAQIVAAGSEGVPFVPGSAALPRFAAGPQAQQYFQAELQWTEGALRFMTGANAPKEEVIRNAATYFPRPGDSNEVIKRKKEARQNMEDSIRLAAGAGSEKVPPKNSGAEKTIVRTGTNKKTGKRVILYSDGTQVEQ